MLQLGPLAASALRFEQWLSALLHHFGKVIGQISRSRARPSDRRFHREFPECFLLHMSSGLCEAAPIVKPQRGGISTVRALHQSKLNPLGHTYPKGMAQPMDLQSSLARRPPHTDLRLHYR